ncbi:MAG TPA: DUF58 domain-containing protein [Solirubrobacteraceae bacterium]|jgi:uncharacterized protein (DUF58 family)|nr:DUF58 domain-containing protein [Solirubrobacteraceae bacterium]
MPRPPATAALGIAMLAAGAAFDVEPLLVAGVAVTGLPVGLWAWCRIAAAGAALTREVDRRRVEEGQPMSMRLVATGRVGLPGGEIVDRLLEAPASLPCGRRRAAVRIEVRFARRGRRRLEPPTLILRDPLGVARRGVRTAVAADVLVLPRVEPVRPMAGAPESDAAPPRAPASGVHGIEPDGLRPYRPGTPASRIHWPALARGAGLLERRLSPEADARPLVILDSTGPVAAEHLDCAVRAAASVCLDLARAGGCSVLLPGEWRPRRVGPDLGAWPGVWASLALVEDGPEPAPGALRGRAGAVIYVAARLPARPEALAPPGSAPLLVAPVAAGRPARGSPVIEVAGCRGYLLGRRARRAAA